MDKVAKALSRPIGGLSAYVPSWRDKISWALAGGAGKLGADKYQQRYVADKVGGVLDFIPGVGEALGVDDAKRDFQAGNYGMAAAGLGLTAAGAIPGADAVTQPVKKGIRAFHGSPHSFDKFSMDKIGTGEGAQAYGHGLYFAENEGVAKSYRDALAKLPDNDPVANAYDLVNKYGQDPAKLIRVFEDMPNRDAMAEGTLQALKSGSYKDFSAPGSMYEVNIAADPEQFLDWDKPLSMDPRNPQRELLYDTANPLMNSVYGDQRSLGFEAARQAGNQNLTGEGLINQLTRLTGDKAKATEVMQKAGIPGIKYLDAGSRNGQYWMDVANDGTISVLGPNRASFGTFPNREEALAFSKKMNDGSGSRNYVVFDDNLISIVKKYGIPAALGAGLITEEMARQMQEQGIGGT